MDTPSKRRALRARLFARQHGRCLYCRGPMAAEPVNPPVPWMATLEHLRQKVKGGDNDPKNLRVACQGCNAARPKGMSPEAYAMLRHLLLPAWPICSAPPDHLRKTLAALAS